MSLWESDIVVASVKAAQAARNAEPDNAELVLECELATPWTWREIDGVVCIGMDGNLDTVHDAALKVTGGFLRTREDNEPARLLAQLIVREHNAKIGS